MSFLKGLKDEPDIVLVGFIGPIISLVIILVSILLSPWFNWFDNALSDLGNYDNGIIPAILFNFGMITTGGVMIVYYARLIDRSKTPLSKLGFFAFLISTVFLVAIGIFSENAGAIHFSVSVGFFLFFPIAMWIIGTDWIRFKDLRWFAVLSLLVPFLSVYMWYGIFNDWFLFSGMAVPEIVTAMSTIFWNWIVAYLYRYNRLDPIMVSESS